MINYKILARWLRSKLGPISDDAVQEGLIAAWKAEEKRPGQKLSFYLTSAENGAKSFLSGKRLTGRDAKGTRRNGGLKDEAPTLFLEGEIEDPQNAIVNRLLVTDALDSLSDDHYEYVRLRFWEGSSHIEAVRKTGVSYTAWYDQIRPTLERELSEADL